MLCEIPLDRLIRCPIQFRPVRKETVDYIRLRDSVQTTGQLETLLVRPSPTKPGFWEVVDGNHRYEILLDLRHAVAFCNVVEMTDEQVRQYQIEVHATRVDVKTSDYARRLWLMANTGPQLMVQEIAKRVHQTVDWVKRMMQLVNLGPVASAALDSGELSVSAAIELSKLGIEEQAQLLPLHKELEPAEFRDTLQAHARHRREGVKTARIIRKASTEETYRDFREVKNERLNPTVAASVITRAGAETKLQVWQAALDWVTRMDAETQDKIRKRADRKEKKELQIETNRLKENHLRRHS